MASTTSSVGFRARISSQRALDSSFLFERTNVRAFSACVCRINPRNPEHSAHLVLYVPSRGQNWVAFSKFYCKPAKQLSKSLSPAHLKNVSTFKEPTGLFAHHRWALLVFPAMQTCVYQGKVIYVPGVFVTDRDQAAFEKFGTPGGTIRNQATVRADSVHMHLQPPIPLYVTTKTSQSRYYDGKGIVHGF